MYKDSLSGLSRSIWLLSLVTLINRSGTMVLPFLTVYLTTRLGYTLEQAGWAMTVFGFGSVAGSYLGGYLTDKIGYYRVQFWSLLLGGFMFLLLMLMESPVEIYLAIFFTSVIGESFRPATFSAIAAYSKPENRTRSVSLIRMAINFGWSLGPALGGWLAASYGYHSLFWVDGLTCIGAAFFLRFSLKPKKGGKVAEEEEPSRGTFISPYQDRIYLFFLVMLLFTAVAFMQFLSTLPVFYKQEVGLSESQIGGLLAMNGILIVLFEMPLVHFLDRHFNKLDVIKWGIALIGSAYFIFNLAGTTIAIAVVSMLALTFGEMLNMPFTNAYSLGRATPANRGKYMGMFTMTYSISLIFAPTIGLQVAAHWGFSLLWYLLAGLCTTAFLGTIFLKKWEAKVKAATATASLAE
ncbi:MAG: MFS transporter [Saprospiraceae bacterium]|nr:MFS transporter [Saprospiraceae bacterium]